MDKKKTAFMLGAGIIISLALTVLAYNWLQQKARAMQDLETQLVAVAKADMPWTTVLTKDMVTTAPYLKKSLADGYIADPAAVSGRTLLYPIKAGEPIFESRLSPTDMKGGGVAAVISPQRRAMAVKVDKIVGVAGFIHPGNRVDVLVTLSQQGKVPTPVTKTVLENVLVLTVGPEVETPGKQEKPAPVDVITLEVTPAEGEKLALAANQGKLQLALRNLGDSEEVITKGTTIPTLLASFNRSEPVARRPVRRAAVKERPAGVSVQLIRGSKTSELKFN